MATVRGFVHNIEVGRAGLVRVKLIQQDGSSGVYVITDLDADPERFNERLSKLAILRDAMDRAEPVELEYSSGEHGNGIDRAVRISRDRIKPLENVQAIMGFVSDVELHALNQATADGEKHDEARINLLGPSLDETTVVLDMQIPERGVAVQQLEMLRDAQARGLVVRVFVDVGSAESAKKDPVVTGVAIVDDVGSGTVHRRGIDGFVESLQVGPLGSFGVVGLTTAPPFSGVGNTVGLTPFTPELIHLLVSKNSRSYELFKAALRDNLRMNVSMARRPEKTEDRDEDEPIRETEAPSGDTTDAVGTGALEHTLSRRLVGMVDIGPVDTTGSKVGLVIGAQILAHLASASRPVWIKISRKSLDHGPDGFECTEGVPSSDLEPRTLREMRIPYPAVWTGIGCFNPGVYRFQLALPTPFRIIVDEEELCLHESDKAGVFMAHSCMHGEHEVRIEIEAWKCEYEFIMDIYQLR